MAENRLLSLEEYPSNLTFIFNINSLSFEYLDEDFLAALGLVAANFEAEQVKQLLFEEDQMFLSSCLEKVLDGTAGANIEFRLKIAGEAKWIRLNAFRMKSIDGQYLLLGNTADITAKVNNNLTVQKFANKKNSVLNVLSHDLRGHLSIVKTISQIMTKEIEEPKFVKFTETIHKVISQSVDLINDLLTREFFESVNVELVKRRIDIAVKIKDYVEEFKNTETHSLRSFNLEVSDDHIFLDLDESKFMQVVNNLISNALKFTRDEGQITIKIIQDTDNVLFVLTDNGIGIPKEMHKHIFDKFTDAGRPGLNGELSIGLGLSIVKTIVEWHNGEIWFESEEDKGTTFYVKIPKEQN